MCHNITVYENYFEEVSYFYNFVIVSIYTFSSNTKFFEFSIFAPKFNIRIYRTIWDENSNETFLLIFKLH